MTPPRKAPCPWCRACEPWLPGRSWCPTCGGLTLVAFVPGGASVSKREEATGAR